jgi:hypothetical protein
MSSARISAACDWLRFARSSRFAWICHFCSSVGLRVLEGAILFLADAVLVRRRRAVARAQLGDLALVAVGALFFLRASAPLGFELRILLVVRIVLRMLVGLGAAAQIQIGLGRVLRRRFAIARKRLTAGRCLVDCGPEKPEEEREQVADLHRGICPMFVNVRFEELRTRMM